MSRNPILTDQAFGLDSSRSGSGMSPAEEWRHAQGLGQDDAATTTAPPPYAGGAPSTAGSSVGESRVGGRAVPEVASDADGKIMTMGGVASASLVLFAFLFVAAAFGWTSVSVTEVVGKFDQNGNQVYDATMHRPWLLFVGMIVGLGLAFLTAFKPKLARVTGILYALCQGYVIGAISAFYGAQFPGIVAQAILATLGVFLVMLVLYGLRVLRATPKFVKGVIAATFGIVVVYGVMLIANLFGVGEGFWTSGSPLGIVISLVVVGVAAMNLILDFDFIERGQQAGLPRYMDWYAAFGLLVTLIWLYLEMLRLLARLRQ